MTVPGGRWSVERLVEDHYAALYRYAFRLSGSAADAEDLTQETFCHAQLKLGQLRDRDKAKALLFSILRNAYLHRVRARKHEHVVSLDGVGDLPDRAAERPYRPALGSEEAREELRRAAGTQFDPRVVEALLGVLGSGS